MKLRPERNSGLSGIRTHDLCDTGAVLDQLSDQAILDLVTLWVRNIPVDGEECKWIYERSYIWTAEKIWRHDWSSQLYTHLQQLWNWSLKKNFFSNIWSFIYSFAKLTTVSNTNVTLFAFVICFVTVTQCLWHRDLTCVTQQKVK